MTTATWAAPRWAKSFYAKFPLVMYEQDDELEWKLKARELGDQACVLWIHPPSATPHAHHRPHFSSNPDSLRTQLLFTLRYATAQPNVHFKPWPVESSAPGGVLPALHVISEEKLVERDEIRAWLEGNYPLRDGNKEWQGFPTQEAYDKALAFSSLILTHLLPAYLACLPRSPPNYHLHFSVPPPLYAGLTTPLPASLTGDRRQIDTDAVVKKGAEALRAANGLVKSGWALGAKRPTSLDALVTSHLYVIYALPENTVLRDEIERLPGLGQYVDRVLDFADSTRLE
ncbi:hypothetical protein L204_104411 [Cryptococcus depauperatus]|nr:hypothetical protein L204_06402 [Cryptococcus depauperatus CBS 7855]